MNAMRKRRAALFGALAVAGACGIGIPSGRASDHLDGPRVTATPPVDITDVFAFTSPDHPTNVVFAMAVAPFAAVDAGFASTTDYVFRVRRIIAASPLTIDPTPLDVVCSFDQATAQRVTCAAASGATAQAIVGDIGGGDAGDAGAEAGGADGGPPMRVFAGLRSDPSFFDRQGMLATVWSGQASFTGQNAWLGANVLAIVVEIDVGTLLAVPVDGGAGAPETGTPDASVPEAAATDATVPDATVPDASPADATADDGSQSDAAPTGRPPPPMLAVAAEVVREGS
jgi:hypothetical protein